MPAIWFVATELCKLNVACSGITHISAYCVQKCCVVTYKQVIEKSTVIISDNFMLPEISMTDAIQSDLQMHRRVASSERCTVQYLRFSQQC